MLYFDYAASTGILPEMQGEYLELLQSSFLNPSAPYMEAVKVKQKVKQAEKKVLSLLGLDDSYQVIWTSGGTESNNMLIQSFAGESILCSAHDHASVLEPVQHCAKTVAHYSYANTGEFCIESFRNSLSDDLSLVVVTTVHNELGTIADLPAIRQAMQESCPQAHLHLDHVQAITKWQGDLRAIAPDSFSLSCHKFHGPHSSGVLVVKKAVIAKLKPLLYGGGQQEGLRSGTIDAANILFAVRVLERLTQGADASLVHYEELREALLARLSVLKDKKGKAIEVKILSPNSASPAIVMFSLPAYQAAVLSRSLGAEGFCVATGSACNAEKTGPNKTLKALGHSDAVSYGALRISFGIQTSLGDLNLLLKSFEEVLKSY